MSPPDSQLPYEELSRLLAGEVDEEEAAALHARIRTDPSYALVWAELQELPRALADLPDPRPPAALDRAVLGGAPRRSWWKLVPLAAAAGVALALVPGSPTQQQTLLDGSSLVDGDVVIRLADGRRVEVDGRALLRVDGSAASAVAGEPHSALLREGQTEVNEMKSSHLIAAAAGAALTVVVYEGSARLLSGDTVQVVRAGETHTDRQDARPEPKVIKRRMSPGSGGAEALFEDADGNMVPASERIAQLEQQLAGLELQSRVQEGRIKASEGSEQPWPAQVPEGFGESDWRDNLEQAIAGRAEIVSVDCSEYPCVAVLSPTGDGDDWTQQMGEIAEIVGGVDADGNVVALAAEAGTDDGGTHRYFSFGATPEGSGEDVMTRTRFRAEAELQGTMAELEEQ